jgi:hypothetical protein
MSSSPTGDVVETMGRRTKGAENQWVCKTRSTRTENRLHDFGKHRWITLLIEGNKACLMHASSTGQISLPGCS